MAEFIEVSTQAELDTALDKGAIPICVGNGYFTASDSATVRASGSATVTAYDSATVWASKYNAVTVHKGPYGTPKVSGGVVIEVPTPTTAEEWCDLYGVRVTRGYVTLFKSVDKDFVSDHRFSYPPGQKVEAPDWDGGVNECGGGLHFCAAPAHALQYFDPDEGGRFIACKVKLADIVVHEDATMPNKVKAPRCKVLGECDIDGNLLASGQSPDGRRS